MACTYYTNITLRVAHSQWCIWYTWRFGSRKTGCHYIDRFNF